MVCKSIGEGLSHYFTADLHLGHGNIMRYCRRTKFMSDYEIACLEADERFYVSEESTNKMDAAIIANINDVCGEQDTLWILGDVFFVRKGQEHQTVKNYFDRITCKNINIVWGNHDGEEPARKRRSYLRPFIKNHYQQGLFNIDHQLIFMNHYPMRSWDGLHKYAWHFYGHEHNRLPPEKWMLALDVGVDGHEYRPWSMSEARAYMKPRMSRFKQKLKERNV